LKKALDFLYFVSRAQKLDNQFDSRAFVDPKNNGFTKKNGKGKEKKE